MWNFYRLGFLYVSLELIIDSKKNYDLPLWILSSIFYLSFRIWKSKEESFLCKWG